MVIMVNNDVCNNLISISNYNYGEDFVVCGFRDLFLLDFIVFSEM